MVKHWCFEFGVTQPVGFHSPGVNTYKLSSVVSPVVPPPASPGSSTRWRPSSSSSGRNTRSISLLWLSSPSSRFSSSSLSTQCHSKSALSSSRGKEMDGWLLTWPGPASFLFLTSMYLICITGDLMYLSWLHYIIKEMFYVWMNPSSEEIKSLSSVWNHTDLIYMYFMNCKTCSNPM